MLPRLTKRLQREKGSERHLLCWLAYITDICVGDINQYDLEKLTLPELLARIQNENSLKYFDETRKYVEKIKSHIASLEQGLTKAEYEIKMIKGKKDAFNGENSDQTEAGKV